MPVKKWQLCTLYDIKEIFYICSVLLFFSSMHISACVFSLPSTPVYNLFIRNKLYGPDPDIDLIMTSLKFIFGRVSKVFHLRQWFCWIFTLRTDIILSGFVWIAWTNVLRFKWWLISMRIISMLQNRH